MPDLYLKILPKKQLALWKKLQAHAKVLNSQEYYLAGGTALALQIGHRQSVDFDFFSNQPETAKLTRQWLDQNFDWTLRDIDSHTLHADIQGVKVSFIGNYRYPLMVKPILADSVRLAGILDIGLMKLLAVTHRAALRDSIDLAAILQKRVSLQTLLEKSKEKYGENFNPLVSLKALLSFQDLDPEMPVLFDKNLKRDWQKILINTVKNYL